MRSSGSQTRPAGKQPLDPPFPGGTSAVKQGKCEKEPLLTCAVVRAAAWPGTPSRPARACGLAACHVGWALFAPVLHAPIAPLSLLVSAVTLSLARPVTALAFPGRVLAGRFTLAVMLEIRLACWQASLQRVLCGAASYIFW